MKSALWWIRRDLRLTDNQTLTEALHKSAQVLPVFVMDPRLTNSLYTGEKRLAFLYAGLRALDSDLRQRGSYLVVRSGNPHDVLSDLLHEVGAEGIFAEEDYSPYARHRDHKIAKDLPLHLTPGLTVHAPETIRKADGNPYTVFTPFSKTWLAQAWPGDPLQAPEWMPTPTNISSEVVPHKPQLSTEIPFQPGEKEAQRRLDAFSAQGFSNYDENRNRMDLQATSGLSPYLRFGMLSARQAVAAAMKTQEQAENEELRKGAKTWLNELIWREFYIAILNHFPSVRKTAFRKELRHLPWINHEDDFAAWTEARTGYPVVDAAMRQLTQTGWMHNRARMISASFLVKDLLVDWRWGERWFMQHLIDGDVAANNGGWQWTAGTGTDAAPYFRVFNPILQGQKFDPHGDYVRHWLPELAQVPQQFIHNPWEMPVRLQKEIGVVIGSDYPAPIIEHAFARQRAVDVFRKASRKTKQ
jgi:deoxyribodipyrimidine photo-lyase